MGKHHPVRSENLRLALAREAARLMAEHGISDFFAAKKKAAARFGVEDGAVLPKNTEIEAALVEYQRMFGGASHAERLQAQRRAALEAMRGLAEFEPRLVGAVLSGSATEHSDVQLHLFADRPESVTFKLIDQRIPHEVTERRLKMNADRVVSYPGVRFEVAEHPVEATVFPLDGIRQAPVSPVDGKPMRRADIGEVQGLVDEAGLTPDA
jgi:predicted nucleotidyltransferase